MLEILLKMKNDDDQNVHWNVITNLLKYIYIYIYFLMSYESILEIMFLIILNKLQPCI